MPRVRRPEVSALLEAASPVASERRRWPAGEVLISAYLGGGDLPSSVTRGVRCLVLSGDEVLLCENAHGFVDPWPGGGRRVGETLVQAARREVLEETGWVIDGSTFAPLGWLHIENLSPVPDDHPYPYPDCLYLVGCAQVDPGAPRPGRGWVDVEGYVLRSWFVPLEQAPAELRGDRLSEVYLALLTERADASAD